MIRQLTTDDLADCMALRRFAFQLQLSPEEQELRRRSMRPEDNWGYFVEGKLAACLALLPLEVYVQGRPLAMGGIASVASWPEYRRQGMAAKLMLHSLEVMRENGQAISLLNPFSYPFYRKYGWGALCDVIRCWIDANRLERMPPAEGSVSRITEGESGVLDAPYRRYAVAYNGMIARCGDWWTRSVFRKKPGHIAVYRDVSGQPQGYVIYSISNRLLQVEELIYNDDDSFRGLWNFLCAHDSMIDRLTVCLPPEDDFMIRLNDPSIRREVHPVFMARIVDVPGFMEQYAFARGRAGRLRLAVSDSAAPWNDGVYELRVDDAGAAAVDRLGALSSCSEEEVVACSIQTLSEMMLGYRSLAKYGKSGLLRGAPASIAWLEQILQPNPCFIQDLF